jgi:hypothetical protein
MLGSTIVSILVVVITTLNDWVTFILVGYLWVLAIVVFYTFGEVVLTLVQGCFNL